MPITYSLFYLTPVVFEPPLLYGENALTSEGFEELTSLQVLCELLNIFLNPCLGAGRLVPIGGLKKFRDFDTATVLSLSRS